MFAPSKLASVAALLASASGLALPGFVTTKGTQFSLNGKLYVPPFALLEVVY